jgi:hypothetical protein
MDMNVANRVRITVCALMLSVNVQAAAMTLAVFKTPTCGCCGKWVDHMKAGGFDVRVTEVQSTDEYRRKYGVPDSVRSCHTATVNGYAIEGHVPADDVKRLLKARPRAKGLAVPGMPIGSPGMEQGARRQAYSVLLFKSDGSVTEFQSYPAK